MTTINTSIFKAYDVRGLYPSEVIEEAARLIGLGFVSYLGAKRIAVSRDMRLSSPSVAAAFIDGARAQGADVVDYGRHGSLYFSAPVRLVCPTMFKQALDDATSRATRRSHVL